LGFGAPGNRTPLEKVKYMDKKNLDLAPYLIALVISILIGSYLISNSIRSGNENTCFAVMYKELKKKNSAMESAVGANRVCR